MKSFFEKLDPNIDYIGQSYSLKLMYIIFIVGYTVSLIAGLLMKNLFYTLIIGISVSVLNFLFTVPAWPYFRKNPLKFKKALKAKDD